MAQGTMTIRMTPREAEIVHTALEVYMARLCNLISDQNTIPEPTAPPDVRQAALEVNDLIETLFGNPKKPDGTIVRILGLSN